MRQTRRRNNKLGDGEIETTGRNYPNETFNSEKKKKCNQGDQEVGQEENNQNHRCLMGKRAVALEDDKGS